MTSISAHPRVIQARRALQRAAEGHPADADPRISWPALCGELRAHLELVLEAIDEAERQDGPR